MDTRQLIEASAEVVTITRLKAGDVYKRVEESGGYGSPLRFGIVQSVMNNGTDSAFTALELTPTYAGITSEVKVFKAGVPAALFAATPHEVEQHTKDLQLSVDRKVTEAHKALEAAREAQTFTGRVIAMALRGELTTPDTTGELEATVVSDEQLVQDASGFVDEQL